MNPDAYAYGFEDVFNFTSSTNLFSHQLCIIIPDAYHSCWHLSLADFLIFVDEYEVVFIKVPFNKFIAFGVFLSFEVIV